MFKASKFSSITCEEPLVQEMYFLTLCFHLLVFFFKGPDLKGFAEYKQTKSPL